MGAPLSLATLWRETLADVRALMPLALPVAAAFVLLPGVAIDLFGPPLPKTPAELTRNVVLIELVLPSLIGVVAQSTVVRLALDRRREIGRSVGEALLIALRMWPLVIIALLLAALPIGVGLLLVVPGLYLAGRLGLAMPLILDGAGPVDALERSWALSAGNGWRVIGFTLLFVAWFVVVSAAAAVVGGVAATLLSRAGASGAGAVTASALGGLVAAVYTVVAAVGLATVYRHLRR